MAGSIQSTYSRSPIPSSNSYDSSPVSSTASPPSQRSLDGGLMRSSPRTLVGQLPQHMNMPLGHSYGHFQNPYSSANASPGPQGMEPVTSAASSRGTPGALDQITSTNMQAQKRAYRQRRKDPSCDACRERKVKCDATETTSCSECSSRNVKCQFTKETNRRMSSIKQVQDLEKQITQVKRENAQLRSMLYNQDSTIDSDIRRQQTPVQLPKIDSNPKRSPKPYPLENVSRIRSNLQNYGRGIFQIPAPYRPVGRPPQLHSNGPELPPKHISDHLITSYKMSIHTIMPILHWPTFEQEYDLVYRKGTLLNVPPVWTSLFFAILAVGVLYSTETFIQRPHRGKEYIETSRMMVDAWNDEFVLDHARTAILTSIFLEEMNMKSAASIWLASAVRIAQDVGLNIESEPWPVIESEMRRRVWWGIYVCDRHTFLDLGRPLLIEDADCDVSFPAAAEDRSSSNTGIIALNGMPPSGDLFLPTIHAARAVSQLLKTLKSPHIPSSNIQTLDSYFSDCMEAFPPTCRLSAHEPLDPRVLTPICYMMSARLVLHRHNLSTSCPPDARITAIESCIRVALDSTSMVARAMAYTSSNNSITGSLGSAASSMTTTHIWRCTLFLLFGGHFDAALTCIRASACIGTLRDVNVCCGRNVAFFLGVLIDKRRSGCLVGSRDYAVERDLDEELVAYVSGDAHALTENSWIWASSEMGMDVSGSIRDTTVASAALRRSGSAAESNTMLTEIEARDWGGWDRVEYLVNVLAREQGGHVQPPQARYDTGNGGRMATDSGQDRNRGSGRMSITSII